MKNDTIINGIRLSLSLGLKTLDRSPLFFNRIAVSKGKIIVQVIVTRYTYFFASGGKRLIHDPVWKSRKIPRRGINQGWVIKDIRLAIFTYNSFLRRATGILSCSLYFATVLRAIR